jgi:hypothetical protein
MRGLTVLVCKEAEHRLDEGRRAGREEAARELLLTLLERKFGPVSAAIRHRVEGADMADVTRWIQNVLGATSADQAFR